MNTKHLNIFKNHNIRNIVNTTYSTGYRAGSNIVYYHKSAFNLERAHVSTYAYELTTRIDGSNIGVQKDTISEIYYI